MAKKQRIVVTIVLEVSERDADDAIDVVDASLGVGGPQESLLDALHGADIKASSVSALSDFE